MGETGGTTLQVNGKWRVSPVTGLALTPSMPTAEFAQSITGLQSVLTYYIELLGTWSASNVGATTTVQQMFFWGLN